MIENERKPDFRWNGLPVYRCRHCRYERVDDLEAVLEHEKAHEPEMQTSAILGPNGEALLIEKGEKEDE